MMVSSNQPIPELTLHAMPALYAEKPWEGVSGRYSFLSTGRVIDALHAEGIDPYMVKVASTRIDAKYGFTKHLIRFRPRTSYEIQDRTIGGVHPEIVLTNSHDRGSSFIAELGLFRLVCSNGLVVASGMMGKYRVRHTGTVIDNVLDAVHGLIEEFPALSDRVRQFQSIQLTQEQREHFAAMAAGLRWEADKVPFHSSRLLSTKRYADNASDLWTTYNVIQENLTRGQNASGYGRQFVRSTREIKAIDSDLAINRGLWQLAESYA